MSKVYFMYYSTYIVYFLNVYDIRETKEYICYLGDTSQRLLPLTSHRPTSNTSIQSIDNAHSLEHLLTALHRRMHRIIQNYDASSFHYALKICARVFQSYASYNLNTIDGFAQSLKKNPRDNKKVLTLINQFHHQLSELRHCHSTFES